MSGYHLLWLRHKYAITITIESEQKKGIAAPKRNALFLSRNQKGT